MKIQTSMALTVAVLLAFVGSVQADGFGTGVNQFSLDFVPISGDAGDLGSWDAGYTFTGVNRDDYRMGTFEITTDQWDKFKAELGVPVTGDPPMAYDANPSSSAGTNVPTTWASWYEAAQFVNFLNTSTGHQAAYSFTGMQGTPSFTLAAWTPAEADNGTNLYRHKDAFYFMPTEDEWVKAAYWNGTSLQDYANASLGDLLVSGMPDPAKWNYSSSGLGEPWNVGNGSLELNGTFDMMGNVMEWMESSRHFGYGVSDDRAWRGASFIHGSYLKSSHRIGSNPLTERSYLGFRVAAEIPEPSTLALLSLGSLALLRRRH